MGPPRASTGCPEREYVENVVVLGMGGSGLAGDVMVAVAGPFVPVPIAVVKSYDLPDFVGPRLARVRRLVLGQHRGDGRGGGRGGQRRGEPGGRDRRAASSAAWPRSGAPRSCPCPTTIPQPRAAIGAMAIPPLVVLEEIGLFPGAAHLGRRWPSTSSSTAADRLVQPGEPGRGGGPPHRPHHPPHPRRPGRRRRRRAALEGPGQRERQVAGLLRPSTPSCATTRSPAGASTATSPARC